VADHLTDEEQLQALKNWWKENGSSIVIAVLVGLIAYFGFQWWQNQQQQSAEQSSTIYSELLEVVNVSSDVALSDEKKATAAYLTKQLQDDYPGSQYALNASLFAAKIAVDSSDLENAETHLQWAVANANDHLKALAQLRLARVYVSQGKQSDALSILNTNDVDSFASLYSELRGDILLLSDDFAGARIAYQEAVDTMDDTSSFRQRLLPIKLANLPSLEQ